MVWIAVSYRCWIGNFPPLDVCGDAFETSIIRDSFVEDVLLAIYLLGVMVIWPLFAHRLFSRAKKLGKEPLRNGSRTSIILYVFFLVLVVLPGTIFSIMVMM